MDFVTVSLPVEVAKGVAGDLGQSPILSRGIDDVATVAVTVIGLGADTLSFVLARNHLGDAWRRVVSFVSRKPSAEKLHVKVDKKFEFIVDLDEVSRDPESLDARIIRMVAELLSGLVDD